MGIYSPQKNYFEIVQLYEKIYQYLFWIVALLSMVFSFLDKAVAVNCISIFALIILAILDFIIEHYKYKAEEMRRLDYFDNSFNTRFNHNPSQEYYDNDDISTGLYKMITNTFESAMFSMEISSKMKEKVIKKNLFYTAIIISFSIYGFSRMSIAVPILQLFISKIFIEDLIYICKYHSRVEKIFNDLTKLFDKDLRNNAESIEKYEAEIIKLYVQYESNISDLKISLDSKVYNQLNESLTEKWSEMKVRYNIK